MSGQRSGVVRLSKGAADAGDHQRGRQLQRLEALRQEAVASGSEHVECRTPEGQGLACELHVDALDAVNFALAAERPLLLLGEPGVGKTRISSVAAGLLGRAYRWMTLDALTEPRDLMWRVDAVRRLGEAQLLGTRPKPDARSQEGRDAVPATDRAVDAASVLDLERFVVPGPLWWAFDWERAAALPLAGAEAQGHGRGGTSAAEDEDRADPAAGVVVLIDEIDKADPSVANGLLEALNDRRFQAQELGVVRCRADRPAPLICITSNAEQSLPAAFLRRCIVHRVALPEGERELVELLVRRGRLHHPEMDEHVLRDAAEQLWRDRSQVAEGVRGRPGQAEYLDLLRAVERLSDDLEGDARSERQRELVERVSHFVFEKHRKTGAV